MNRKCKWINIDEDFHAVHLFFKKKNITSRLGDI